MSRKDWLENNPAKAGEMECYWCGHRIGDAEYRVTQDGCVAHYQCQMEEATCEHGVRWSESCHTGPCFREGGVS